MSLANDAKRTSAQVEVSGGSPPTKRARYDQPPQQSGQAASSAAMAELSGSGAPLTSYAMTQSNSMLPGSSVQSTMPSSAAGPSTAARNGPSRSLPGYGMPENTGSVHGFTSSAASLGTSTAAAQPNFQLSRGIATSQPSLSLPSSTMATSSLSGQLHQSPSRSLPHSYSGGPVTTSAYHHPTSSAPQYATSRYGGLATSQVPSSLNGSTAQHMVSFSSSSSSAPTSSTSLVAPSSTSSHLPPGLVPSVSAPPVSLPNHSSVSLAAIMSGQGPPTSRPPTTASYLPASSSASSSQMHQLQRSVPTTFQTSLPPSTVANMHATATAAPSLSLGQQGNGSPARAYQAGVGNTNAVAQRQPAVTPALGQNLDAATLAQLRQQPSNPSLGASAGARTAQASSQQSQAAIVQQRRHAIQQQLMLLIHSFKCKYPADPKPGQPVCPVLHCGTMKKVLEHMSKCNKGRQCTEPHCGSSRQIISHYSSCKNPECSICAPMRRPRNKGSGASSATMSALGQAAGGNTASNSSLNPALPGLTQTANGAGARFQATPNGIAAGGIKQEPVSNPASSAASASIANTWRAQLVSAQRIKLIQKLMENLAKCVSPEDQQTKKQNIEQLAKKIELKMYQKATTREEYYQFLAEKIYKLKKAYESRCAAAAQAKEPPIPKRPKVFEKSLLLHHFLPLHNALMEHEESEPFRQPVDPVALGIPDYFDVIKHPMDLSTIGKKLQNGDYTDPWQYCDDVRLMFDNAWTYNDKSTKVHKIATRLSEMWESRIDPIMRRMNFCCGKRYAFNPQVLYCSGKPICTIKHGQPYMSYTPETGSPVYYCLKCWKEVEGDGNTIANPDAPDDESKRIPTTLFQELKHDKVDYEPFVNCEVCDRKFHSICVLWHKDLGKPFICKQCKKSLQKERGESTRKKEENPYSAKRLKNTKLSDFLESRVKKALKEKGVKGSDLFVRVVSAKDKQVASKEGISKYYADRGESFPESFPNRTKAILVFQKQEDCEVCFFAMHVQEYGADCPEPNKRRVYISYLDSVHFFNPPGMRTTLYHELLMSYLDYVRQRGFLFAHIWACPPSPGDDYIFHCHPPEQKTPTPKRLQNWYRDMLMKAKDRQTVYDYYDMIEFMKRFDLTQAKDLPYFEGDFWPGRIDDVLKEMAEEAKSGDESSVGQGKGKKGKKAGNKRGGNKKGKGGKKGGKKSQSLHVDEDLADRLVAEMEKYKSVFFVVQLHKDLSKVSFQKDKDPEMHCDLMDGRDALLTLCRENHYEFSDLRRTKYSSLMVLYNLHTADLAGFTCNECHKNIPATEIRLHCTVCADFDMCEACFNKKPHEHKMEKFGLMVAQDDKKNLSAAERIRNLLRLLEHCSTCNNPVCTVPNCERIKNAITHVRSCPKRSTPQACRECMQLLQLIKYHYKVCKNASCPLPFCLVLKQREARLNQQNARARMMEVRRRAQMTSGDGQQPSPAVNAAMTSAAASHRASAQATTMATHATASSQSQAQSKSHEQSNTINIILRELSAQEQKEFKALFTSHEKMKMVTRQMQERLPGLKPDQKAQYEAKIVEFQAAIQQHQRSIKKLLDRGKRLRYGKVAEFAQRLAAAPPAEREKQIRSLSSFDRTLFDLFIRSKRQAQQVRAQQLSQAGANSSQLQLGQAGAGQAQPNLQLGSQPSLSLGSAQSISSSSLGPQLHLGATASGSSGLSLPASSAATVTSLPSLSLPGAGSEPSLPSISTTLDMTAIGQMGAPSPVAHLPTSSSQASGSSAGLFPHSSAGPGSSS